MKLLMLVFVAIGIAGLWQGVLGASLLAFALVPLMHWFDREITRRMAAQKAQD